MAWTPNVPWNIRFDDTREKFARNPAIAITVENFLLFMGEPVNQLEIEKSPGKYAYELRKLEEARKHQTEADKYYDETLLKAKVDAEKTKMQILKETQATQEARRGAQGSDDAEAAGRVRAAADRQREARARRAGASREG